MDRNLPDVEGSAYISLLRDRGMDIPVIFLSAKSSRADIEEGFLCGGDDYIAKPFEMKELLLRVNAILHRTKKDSQKKLISYRDIVLDTNLRLAQISGESVELTKLEFDLLQRVWGAGKQTEKRTVNVAIKRLKEKIDPEKNHDYIKTIRGIGYSLQ